MDSVRSTTKIINQTNKLLDELEVLPAERQIANEAITGKASLMFVIRWKEEGQEWQAYIQKNSTLQKGLENNLAAIHLWLQSRCLNIRRGVESPGEAFGAHLVKGSNIPPSWGEHFLSLKLNLLEMPSRE